MRHENKYLKFDRDVKTSHHVLLHIQCDGRVICFHILQHQIWATQRSRQNRAPNYSENDFGKSYSVNVTTLNWTLCASVLLSGSHPALWGSSWFHPTFFPRLCINHSLSLSSVPVKLDFSHLLEWTVSPSAISSLAAWKQEHPSPLARLTSSHPSVIRCHSLRESLLGLSGQFSTPVTNSQAILCISFAVWLFDWCVLPNLTVSLMRTEVRFSQCCILGPTICLQPHSFSYPFTVSCLFLNTHVWGSYSIVRLQPHQFLPFYIQLVIEDMHQILWDTLLPRKVRWHLKRLDSSACKRLQLFMNRLSSTHWRTRKWM